MRRCSATQGSAATPGSFDPTDTPPANFCNWRDEITIDPSAFNQSGLVQLMVS